MFRNQWWLQDAADNGEQPGAASGGAAVDTTTTGDAAPEAAAVSEGGGEQQSQQQPQQPKTALEAVQRAMTTQRAEAERAAQQQPGQEQGAQPGDQPGAEQPQQQPAAGQQQGKAAEKDANTRIRELVGQVKHLEPRAQHWDKLATWVQESGLSQRDVVTGLELMRLLRVNPAAAHKMLEPINAQLSEFVGTQLPADLQEKVDAGRLDEETARELAHARASQRHGAQLSAEEQDRRRATAARERVERQVQEVGEACSKWENDWAGKDPDYKRKQPHVTRMISHLMMTEGAPRAVKDAVDLCNRAKEAVEKELKDLLPAPRGQNPPTGGAGPRSTTQPKTSLEAAKRGLEMSTG